MMIGGTHFDLTHPYPALTLISNFHVTAELVIVDTKVPEIPLFLCICRDHVCTCNPYCLLAVTISGEVNKNCLEVQAVNKFDSPQNGCTI